MIPQPTRPESGGHSKEADIEIPLKGVIPNVSFEVDDRGPEHLLALLASGKTLEQIHEEKRGLTTTTSRSWLWVTSRNALVTKGISTGKINALLDHPHPEALPAVIAELTGTPASHPTWSSAFQTHITNTYRDGYWANSAAPSANVEEINRIMAVVRQRPTGVSVQEICVIAEVDRTTVRYLVNSPIERGLTAKMLLWVPGREHAMIQAHPCPHLDCPGSRPYATSVAPFPETIPDRHGIGGVLCPDCSRLPLLEYAHVRFPTSWHRPVTVISSSGTRGDRRTLLCDIQVPRIAASVPVSYTADELAARFNLSRKAVIAICDDAHVASTKLHRGVYKTMIVYDAAEATRAIRLAIDPEGR